MFRKNNIYFQILEALPFILTTYLSVTSNSESAISNKMLNSSREK